MVDAYGHRCHQALDQLSRSHSSPGLETRRSCHTHPGDKRNGLGRCLFSSPPHQQDVSGIRGLQNWVQDDPWRCLAAWGYGEEKALGGNFHLWLCEEGGSQGSTRDSHGRAEVPLTAGVWEDAGYQFVVISLLYPCTNYPYYDIMGFSTCPYLSLFPLSHLFLLF